MKQYTTLHNVVYGLEGLSNLHKVFIKKVFAYYKRQPSWNRFSNYWIKEGQKIWKDMNRKDVVKHPTFKICRDLESRLGIAQGYVRKTDYRDELLRIIDQYPSRYSFCKAVEMDETFLSHILSKRKNLSITKLQEVLEKTGHEMTFTKKTGNTQSTELFLK